MDVSPPFVVSFRRNDCRPFYVPLQKVIRISRDEPSANVDIFKKYYFLFTKRIIFHRMPLHNWSSESGGRTPRRMRLFSKCSIFHFVLNCRLSGVVVSVPDSYTVGRVFESWLEHKCFASLCYPF